MWGGSMLGNAVAGAGDPSPLPGHCCLELFEMPLGILPVPAASLEKYRSPVDPLSKPVSLACISGVPWSFPAAGGLFGD